MNQRIGEGATTLDMLYSSYPWLKEMMDEKDAEFQEMFDNYQDIGREMHKGMTELEDKLGRARGALEYLRAPTMGYEGDCSHEEFAEKYATNADTRLALTTCIALAQKTLDELNE